MTPYKTHPAITALKESGKYSDLTLKCEERTFRVHRAQVCPQSEFFSRICDGSFKEAHEGVIELQDDDPEHVARMVSYFYEFDYADCDATPTGAAQNEGQASTLAGLSEESLINFMDVDNAGHSQAVLAELAMLRELEIPHVIGASTWENVLEEKKKIATNAQYTNIAMYALGEKYIIPELENIAVEKFKKQDVEYWKDSMHSILREVYCTTPSSDRGLRDPLVAIYVTECDPETKEEQESLKEIPEAYIDILRRALSVKKMAIKEYKTLAHGLQRENENSKRELERALTKANEERNMGLTAWANMQGRLNGFVECRHCDSKFNMCLDETESKYECAKIVLRCRSCRTRH